MHVLIVSATPFEVAPTAKWLDETGGLPGEVTVEFLVTGIGQLATAFALGRRLADSGRPVDLLLQAGVGGSFDYRLPLGSVVYVNSDRAADLGAEDASGEFLSLADIGLTYPDPFALNAGTIRVPTLGHKALQRLPWVDGLTVNRASGTEATIRALRLRFPNVTVETMEGAAAAFAAVSCGLDFVHLRGISNHVTVRDREGWQLAAAVAAVNETVIELLVELAGV